MLSDKMREALNQQINAELYSAYMYFSMAAFFEAQSLNGCASWMKVQAQEEMTHAVRFYNYVNNAGGQATMLPIEGPPAEWDSPLAVFEAVYAHEQKVTGLINDLVTLANEEKDYATLAELQWFVTEQVEEEASADAVVQKLKLMQGAPGGLFMLDRELAPRVFTMPAWLNGG